jgi:hypothetical protein
MTDAPDRLPAFGATGRCLKCGRPIDPGETMCEVCNRAGMVAPAATQMHGTLAVAIIGSVIGLGVLAALLLGGVGPFPAEVTAVTPVADTAVQATVELRNEGSRAGRARCQLTAVDAEGTTLSQVSVVSTEIAPGASAELTAEIRGLDEDPYRVVAVCQ